MKKAAKINFLPPRQVFVTNKADEIESRIIHRSQLQGYFFDNVTLTYYIYEHLSIRKSPLEMGENHVTYWAKLDLVR